jgi:fatty-acyl-CoA synthase
MREGVWEGCSLGDLIVRAIQRFPDRVALVHGTQEVTYQAMGHHIRHVCQVLSDRGLRRADGLAHLTRNCPEAVYVAAAAYLMGVRYVPLHPLGSVDDSSYIVEHSESRLLVMEAGAFPGVDDALGSLLRGRAEVVADADLLSGIDDSASGTPLSSVAVESDIARVAYTGGTTGRPKGVMQSHRSMVTNAVLTLAEIEWPRDVRFLCITPISHATAYMMVPIFCRGGTFVLERAFSADIFCEAVERHSITSTLLVPTMIYALLDHPETASKDLSGLELIIYGASPISPGRLGEALERFGPILQQTYGLTESPNCISTLKKSDHLSADHARLASCGLPYAGNRVAILGDDAQEVARGEFGEVCLRSPLVMDGYWNQPTETAKAFADGWFHTGDIGCEDEDGYLYLVDRKNDLIISGGFNVYAREVEDVLTTHMSVAQAVVIGVPDPKWGEAVKALVVLRPGYQVSSHELIALVRTSKGPVHAPKSVEFVAEIPMTAVGKPDKKALRARFWMNASRQVN